MFCCDDPCNALVVTSFHVAVMKTAQVFASPVLWSVMYSKRSEARAPPSAGHIGSLQPPPCVPPRSSSAAVVSWLQTYRMWHHRVLSVCQRTRSLSVMLLANIQQNKWSRSVLAVEAEPEHWSHIFTETLKYVHINILSSFLLNILQSFFWLCFFLFVCLVLQNENKIQKNRVCF